MSGITLPERNYPLPRYTALLSQKDKGVPKGWQGSPPDGPIFLKKRSIFEKNWYFWAKKWDFAPPPNFFFILPPSKISLGYALGLEALSSASCSQSCLRLGLAEEVTWVGQGAGSIKPPLYLWKI